MAGMKWSADYLEGLSPICCECNESCWGCDGVIKLNEGKVAHYDCYKKLLGTFEDFIRHGRMRCSECRHYCDASEDVKEIGVDQVMHGVCYEKVLLRIEQKTEPLPKISVAVRLPGEEMLSRLKIAERRHKSLHRKRRAGGQQRRSPKDGNAK